MDQGHQRKDKAPRFVKVELIAVQPIKIEEYQRDQQDYGKK
jgi:hypothetical protein